MFKVYMNHKWILCLDLGSIPKVCHVSVNIPKLEHLWAQVFQVRDTQYVWQLKI
jgi:hypothetical protein